MKQDDIARIKDTIRKVHNGELPSWNKVHWKEVRNLLDVGVIEFKELKRQFKKSYGVKSNRKTGYRKLVPGVLRALLRKPNVHPPITLPNGIVVEWGKESDDYEYGLSNEGYLTVKYGVDKKEVKLVHRLVAEQYLDNKQKKTIVHHIDKNKRNNLAENLMWVTETEHAQYHKHLQWS